eukprot:g45651.t1
MVSSWPSIVPSWLSVAISQRTSVVYFGQYVAVFRLAWSQCGLPVLGRRDINMDELLGLIDFALLGLIDFALLGLIDFALLGLIDSALLGLIDSALLGLIDSALLGLLTAATADAIAISELFSKRQI